MIVKGETNERAKRVPGEEVLKRIREEAVRHRRNLRREWTRLLILHGFEQTSKVEEIDGNCVSFGDYRFSFSALLIVSFEGSI